MVNDLHKGMAFVAGSRSEDLQIPDSEAIHPYELRTVYPGNRADIAQAAVVGLFEIYEQGSRTADAKRAGVNGETLERAEEIKNATRFKKLENKNNTNNIDDLFV